MAATLLIQDNSLTLLADDQPIGPRRLLDAEAIDTLQGFGTRYTALTRWPDPAALLTLGRDLHDWLDGPEGLLRRLADEATPPLLFTVHSPRQRPEPADWAVLHAPWELLADAHGFWADNALLQYSPLRRIGPRGTPDAPDDHRLGLAFMTASPEGVDELDYEAEEAAILKAVGSTDLDLLVDESGQAAALAHHLQSASQPPVLHLSCHGHDAWPGPGGQPPRPVLLLEDADFRPAPADAATLITALRPAMPRLVFLSACLTAAPGEAAPAGPGDAPATAHALSSALVGAGLPAALGWAGSVDDRAAIAFAAEFYQRLAHHDGLAPAVAEARRALLRSPDPAIRDNWPMARLWVGARCDPAAPLARGRRKRSLLGADHIQKAFLGKNVPVAAHAMFVGRRRELKRALSTLDGNAHAGVILTGMGRLGKSSLAARIVNRRHNNYAVAVLHGPFGALDLLDCLADALQGQPAARALLEQGRRTLLDAIQRGPEDALIVLAHALTDLLGGPCQQAACDGPHGRPLLLVLDDFEQLLDESPGPRPVVADRAGLLATLLAAFQPERSDSRLLVTSRFPFTLLHGGLDLAAGLLELPLGSFSATAAAKLALRQRNAAPAGKLPDLAARCALLPRAQAAARGNPGLQDLLCSQLLLNPAVPLASTRGALEQMEAFLAGGQLPDDEHLRSLLEAIAVDTLLGLAGEPGCDLLRRLCVFAPLPLAYAACNAAAADSPAPLPADPLPLPLPVAEALAGPGPLATLRALGLVEPAPDPAPNPALPSQPALRPSPLAAGRVDPPDAPLRRAVARQVCAPLATAWGSPEATPPAEARLLLGAVALLAGDSAVAAAHGALAVKALEAHSYPAAARLAEATLAQLERNGHPPPLPLLAVALAAAASSGDGPRADALLETAVTRLRATPDAPPADALPLLDAWASRLYRRGELDEALRIREQEELPVYRRLGDVRAIAVTQGQIADILHARGQLDEALRIREQEELPVYRRLGDVRAIAITQGKIADILYTRGQLDEALRIREREQLPTLERLGDVRAIAVTQGKIADILHARGQLDEALRIREQEQLPVYCRLGDVRAIAITQGQIADILQARGQLDEALRIREQEELPVYRRLGDVRSTAITQGQIADILEARGQLDEALRIREQEQLPVYRRLGDVRAVAVTQGKIADILHARGQLDEALRIREQEELPVYRRLGDVREIAVTQGKIADILHARGQLDEALRIREQEQLPVYRRLGDVRSIAITQGQIADILQARGQLDEALRIREQEELPVYRRLGDVRAVAITQGQIADILHARGQLDEALRIREQEELPVYRRLGDVRSIAITQGQIADILHARGQLDEALRIREQEQLPVYRRLGDVRSIAITQGKIADILHARGQLDEALRTLQQDSLPAFQQLGSVRDVAVIRGKIADILHARGQLDEALRIREQEQLPVYRRLGDVREIAITQGTIADILHARGQLDEALRIREQEELPVYRRLGDVRAVAVTQGKIADILHARGQLDEALRIREQEELPVYRRLGDVREIAITQGTIADILHARGQLDEALRIREQEQLPALQHLGDVRALLVARANLALNLLARAASGDRERAAEHLCLALADARRLRIPEAGQIEAILQHYGLRCDA